MSDLNTIGELKMRFVDNTIPALPAGTYEIEVHHTITEHSYKIEKDYTASQRFVVKAPRFTLPVGVVQSQFPLQGADVDFHVNLPYIVFRHEHLPWARSLANGDLLSPWMALMIFTPNELVYSPPNNGEPNPTRATVRSIDVVANYSQNNIKGPVLYIDDAEKTAGGPLKAETIDVLADTFRQLAPQQTELQYLAHVRTVDSAGNAADGEAGKQTYAALLANRFGDPAQDQPYIAHVVSLEGWANYLPGGSEPVVTGQTLRLVSLYSWNFTGKAAGISFGALVKNMTAGTLKLPFVAPASWGSDPQNYSAARKEVQKKYNNGYVAMDYDTRTGEESFAWYRGPFTPTVPLLIKNLEPQVKEGEYLTRVSSADKAIIYDAETGTFDHSYAVAWEMGRMLTLANRPAALAIWQWKNTGIQKIQTLNRIIADKQKKQRKLLGTAAPLKSLLDTMNWQQVKDDLTDDQAGTYTFMDYLGRTLGKHILGDRDEQPVVSVLDPTGLQQHGDSMPGVLNKEAMLAAMEKGIDPHVLISNLLNEALKLSGKTNEQ